MKVTETGVTVYRIELEEADTVWDLWEHIGFSYVSTSLIAVRDGAIEIREESE